MLMMFVVVMAAFMFVLVVVMAAADGACFRFFLRQKVCRQGIALLHRAQQLCAGELVPGGGDDGGVRIFLPQEGHGGFQLFPVHLLGAAEDDSPGILDLVGIELAEVLHIHLSFARIGYRYRTAQGHLRHLFRNILDGADDVRELAHAGRLDKDAVGVELIHHFFQSLAKIAHQGAADAPGVHLGNLHARVLEETAVNADFAKLVLNEDEFFALKGFVQELLDQRGLASAQEAGNYVYLSHGGYASFLK